SAANQAAFTVIGPSISCATLCQIANAPGRSLLCGEHRFAESEVIKRYAVIVLAVGGYDYWAVRAAGYRFEWGRDLGGYYDYLGRAFAHGTLALPIQPRPELLALSNPYDPAANEPYRMHDMAFYHGRYYLYHGAGPAVFLFAPWRLLTGHDLPENFALFLLS